MPGVFKGYVNAPMCLDAHIGKMSELECCNWRIILH